MEKTCLLTREELQQQLETADHVQERLHKIIWGDLLFNVENVDIVFYHVGPHEIQNDLQITSPLKTYKWTSDGIWLRGEDSGQEIAYKVNYELSFLSDDVIQVGMSLFVKDEHFFGDKILIVKFNVPLCPFGKRTDHYFGKYKSPRGEIRDMCLMIPR